MDTFPDSPRLIRGGIVLMDPDTSQVLRIIVLQYNPDTLTRTLQVQSVGGEGSDKSEALRLKGPPIETIKIDAEIDGTDQLEFPEENMDTVMFGIQPQLSALEMIVYPSSLQLQTNYTLAQMGDIEIIPLEAPFTLFVWSATRILPVKITEFSITEEAFDPHLNPIRAKVSLGMRVLSINDLRYDHMGGSLFMAYLQQKEFFAAIAQGTLGSLGISGIP